MRRLLLPAFLAVSSYGEPAPIQRTILAVYNGAVSTDVRDTRIHQLLEMPLNHLGLVVRYQDLRNGLPDLGKMQDVRGIVTWFRTDSIPHPAEFLSWGERAVDSGKRFVILGRLGFSADSQGRATPIAAVNHFLVKLGGRVEGWVPVTYDQRIAWQDPAVMGFERPFPAVLPPFDHLRIVDAQVRSHLTIRQGKDASSDAHLVATGPHGGWAVQGYTHFASDLEDQLQWYINPFEFLRLAFATDDIPKPDTTTLSGRRIYYSQVDGDGWRNQTEAAKYRRDKLSSAQVVLREAIRPFPDLPVTVGPIAGDLDPDWFGTTESLHTAREILALPWVEAGSHTYSHPLDWESLFQQLSRSTSSPRTRNEEIGGWLDPSKWTVLARVAERYSKTDTRENNKGSFRRGHSKLRSYAIYPFRLDQEIDGSIAFLNRQLPAGKNVKVLQWSGTTLAPEPALRAAMQAGVRNINGGDTRFDAEFDSYTWVAPLGRPVSGFWQIYSSDSNENTYTDSWHERYFGFRYLPETLRRTESPIRVKPFNIYYHMYSGEKQPGIDAVVDNLRYARSQELAPIETSRYSAIADGFYSAQMFALGPARWRIENRDGLDTVRFDHADSEFVDRAASSGVIGERHYQGSLYVALDRADPAPVVALTHMVERQANLARPWLIQSRWMISGLQISNRELAFDAHGYGAGEMEWKAAPDARYKVMVFCEARVVETLTATANHEGKLAFTIRQPALDKLRVKIVQTGSNR